MSTPGALVNMPRIGEPRLRVAVANKTDNEVLLASVFESTAFHTKGLTFEGMVAEFVRAIHEAQVIGYRQAMADVRALIGAKGA